MKKSNFYLLYSGDKSLLSNEVNKLKKNLNITSDSIYYDIENVSDIIVEASTIGMFDPYKFIVIDSGSYFLQKSEFDISLLEEYFNNYNTNSYLIFILNSGSVDSKKKLYKLINDNGTINKLSVTEEYLDTFVRNYIKDNGFTMSNMDIKFFLGRCNKDIDNIKNELDKLMLYKLEEKVIDKDDIILLVDEDIDDTVFELVSSILKNDCNKAMKLYYNFINNGMDVSQIIAIIASQIRLLFQVKRLYNSGKSNEEIAKILEFKSPYRVKYLLNDCYYYSEDDLIKYLSKLADIDKNIKSGNGDGEASSNASDGYASEEEYDDPIYNEVVDFAVNTGKISASLIQRKFRLGYNRAARIIDLLEERGIIGPQNGSKPREVLVKLEKPNDME